jgi:hypothetical protein
MVTATPQAFVYEILCRAVVYDRMHINDPEIAEHYRDQVTRLRIMSLVLRGTELKTRLLATARMYEGLAEKLEKHARLIAGDWSSDVAGRYNATLH